MISFLDIFRTQDRAESISSILAAGDSESFRVNPRYLPECISGAVAQSRIYHRVRMEFTNLRSLSCAWKPVAEAVWESKRRKLSLFLIHLVALAI